MRRQEERGSLGRPKELRLATILARYVANKRFHADYPPRRGEERPLRDTEELFRSLANTLPVMIWMSGVDNLCTFFNEPKLKFAGRSLESVVGSGWTESVHPKDLHRCWAISNSAFDLRAPFDVEFRFRRYDGEYRWILSSGVPRFTAGGSFVGYIGSATDITERKLAEESLTKVSRKFILAQEEERVRIVDALHGHIDSLILLSTNLDGYEQRNPSSSDVRQEIGEIRQQVKDIVGGILDLSHHLHIAKLQYLGLAGAAASFCKELSDRQKVKIDFHSRGVPNELPKEVALSLFRVLQEALQNAIKHSGSQQFEVSLTVRSDRIELTVRDWGIGFDPAAAAKGPGLGLVSMRERLKLVDGDLLIESQPQRGTTVHVGVPLKT